MNHASVTLDEVLAAAAARAASIVSETSGYLVLALGDLTARAPCALDPRAVTLSTEGTVAVARRGATRSPEQGAEGLRAILARLLSVGTGSPMPALAAASRARAESQLGIDAVVQEIEAALIPVNRAAARRALARLARETLRARETGKLNRVTLTHLPPSTPPPRSAPPEAAAPEVPARPPARTTEIARSSDRDAREVELAPPTPTPSSGLGSAVVDRLGEETHAALAGSEPPTVVLRDPAGPLVLPLRSAVTPAPPQVWTPEPERIDRTPTLIGVAPVAMTPSPVTELDAGAKTIVDAVAEIGTPTPLDLEAEPFPSPRGELAVAPARVIPACLASAASSAGPPTGADDLLARFGASCVDDAGLAATRASLRRMAGLDLTPPPPTPGAAPEPSLPLRAHLPVVDRAASSDTATPAPDPFTPFTPTPEAARGRAPRASRARAVLAMSLALGLAAIAAYRFLPQASGLVLFARDMLRTAPAAAPPPAPEPAAVPTSAAPPAATSAAVDRPSPRAERGAPQVRKR